MPFRIMHVIDGLGRGGAERVLVEIANESVRRGHFVACCVTRTDTTLAADLLPEVEVQQLGRTRRVDVSALRRFRRLVKSQRFDVLHAHSRSTVGFLAAARLVGGPLPALVFHDHFGGEGRLPRWFSMVGPNLVSEYVAVAPRLERWARRSRFPTERLQVIGNRMSLRRIQEVPALPLRAIVGVPEDAPLGICVCGIRRDKGVDLLIEAVAALRDRKVDVHIAMVGRDVDAAFGRRCREMARELAVDDLVHFLGERSDAIGLMRGADFGVVPSRSESGPLVLIEYLAVGLPVVASQTGDVADRASAAGLAGMVPPGDSGALAEGILEIARLGQTGASARGQAGRATAEFHFDLAAAMPQWEAVYARAIAGRRERGR